MTFTITDYCYTDNYSSEEEFIDDIKCFLPENLEGEIYCSSDIFAIDGKIGDALVEIRQRGEYNMYGGPYNPKMEDFTALVNGKSIKQEIIKCFADYGWDDENYDLMRIDIWGHLIKC
jgi:hypothetical protein